MIHSTGTGWCENSTRWKSCKRVRARIYGACACLTHGLQCLCDGRACCPAPALQLVICRSVGVHRRRHLVPIKHITDYTTVVLVVCDAIYFLSFQYYIEHTSCSTHHKHQKTICMCTHTQTHLGTWEMERK
jgi:hypothetical protein